MQVVLIHGLVVKERYGKGAVYGLQILDKTVNYVDQFNFTDSVLIFICDAYMSSRPLLYCNLCLNGYCVGETYFWV